MLAAFDHVEGNRVPAWCGSSDEFWAKAKAALGLDDEGLRVRFGDDFRRVRARYAGPEFPLSERAHSRTPFGVERCGMGYGQPINHPLAGATLDAVHAYAWLDPSWMDVSGIRADAQWHPDRARADLCGFLDAAAGRCHVELIMKDISTVRYQPQRLWEWAAIAMDVADEYAR